MLRKCLVSILTFWCLYSYSQTGDSPVLETRVSIDFNNVSLPVALKQLNRQADIRFSYDSNIIPRTSKIISTYRGELLSQILDDLLLGVGLYYKEINGGIVINKRVFTNRQLRGVVIGEDHGEPLPFANVFIDNSVLGIATDKNGEFLLENLPDRAFDLVVSYVGYEPQMIPFLYGVGPDAEKVEVVLRLDTKTLDRVIVSAPPSKKDIRRDKRIMRRFEEEFLGRSDNSKKCRIVNPEELNLEVLDGKNKYRVTAENVLFIENRALGYRIEYYLDEFLFDNGAQSTKGTAYFKELKPKSRKQNRLWENARRDAYYGSLQHFLNSLMANDVREQGFEVNIVQFDSVTSEYTTFHNPPAVQEILTLQKTETGLRYLMTANADIEITYKKETEDADYIKQFRTQSKSGNYKYTDIKRRSGIKAGNQIIQVIIDTEEDLYQKSVILFKNRQPLINPQGVFSNDDDAQYLGWWNWGGISDKLPVYYKPRY